MHSSELRDDDFAIESGGAPVSLADFFNGHTSTRRLGLLTPQRTEGVGAVALVMAHVTAFYNTYRAAGGDFFAYPDFFTFQSREPVAAYSMFDIWPNHKNVRVGDNPVDRLNAITDRAVNILLVPAGASAEHDFQRQQLASAARLIDTCYLYSPAGTVEDPDLVIRCAADPIAAWCRSVIDSLPEAERSAHALPDPGDTIEQSFRRIALDEALSLL